MTFSAQKYLRLCWREGEGEEVDIVAIHVFFEIGLIRSLLGFYNHFMFFLSLRFIFLTFEFLTRYS